MRLVLIDHSGNVYLRYHDSDRLYSFGVPKKFNIADGQYTRVTLPEKLVLKYNASLKLIVDDKDQLLDCSSGTMLPVDRPYRHISCVCMQMKAKGKRKALSLSLSFPLSLSLSFSLSLCACVS